ncbi:tape measure protein [Nesterenkonia sphaerica]|uniref:Tape measure protein n=1 Tax=Nesterenkonia sphaerica TaxID=1804988 RepID=A0A5R9A2P2_9MICC|nr:tape measure protein [Nesterenkonia sphaerica]TLP72953.1 tape measure protein [Nesterenkonia sphaerica]
MADRTVTVVLSADISGYIRSMDQAAQATDRAATSADKLDQSASRASQAAQASSQGFQQASSAADSASGSMENLGSATQAASTGASASSEALFRLSGGISGTASEADRMSGAFTQATTTTGTFANGLQGLGSSFAAGLSYTEGFSGALLSLGGAAVTAGEHFGTFGREISRINQENRGFAAGLAITGGGIAAVMTSVINTGIAYNTLQQVAGRAMETMTGSAEAAANQMDRLHEFADTSPFARDVWIEAQQQLMAFGMEAENVVPTMEGIQNAVAAIGGGDQEVMRLVEILGQVQGQGRITGRELQRMGQMGINAADIIGEAMGVSGNEIREQITAGALDAETAISALTEGMNTRFAGAAEGLRDTMTGALDRIRARIRDLGGIIATPLVNPNGGGFLVGAINMAADFGSALLEINPLILQLSGLGLTAAAGIVAMGGAWGLARTQILAFATGAKQALVATANLTRGLFTTLGGLRTLAVSVGAVAAAWGAWTIIKRIGGDVDDFTGSIGSMEQALVRLAEGQRGATDSLVDFDRWSLFGDSVEGLSGAMERLTDPSLNNRLREMGADFLGLANDMTVSSEAVDRFDQALVSAFEAGNYDQAAAGMREVAQMADQLGWSAEDLANRYPRIISALEESASASGVVIDAQALLADGVNAAALAALAAGEDWEVISGLLEEGADATYNAASAFDEAAGSVSAFSDAYAGVADAVDEATGSLGELVENLMAVGEMNMDAEAKVHSHADAVREMNDLFAEEETRLADLKVALEEGTISQAEYDAQLGDTLITLDESTQAGSDYAGMMRDMVMDVHSAAEGMAILGASEEALSEHLNSGIEDIIAWRMAAGESREQAEEWIRTMLGIPDNIDIETHMDRTAQLIAEETARTINEIPTWVEILVGADDEEAQAALTALETGDYEALVEIIGDDERAREVAMAFVNGDWETLIALLGEDEPVRSLMRDFTNNPWSTDVDFNGNDTPARSGMGLFIDTPWNTPIRFDGEDSPARSSMGRFTGTPWATDVDFNGNDGPVRADMGLFINTPWNTTVTANAATFLAEAALNRLARTRTATIRVGVVGGGVGSVVGSVLGRRAAGGRVGMGLGSFASGGRPGAGLPRRSTGGRLPATGLGTDQILGISSLTGQPTAFVDDREWVVNRKSSDRYDDLLHAINQDRPAAIQAAAASIPKLAVGGRSGPGMFAREFPASSVRAHSGGGSIDYDRLARAMASGPRVALYQTNHNPVRETDIEATLRGLDQISIWDTSAPGGDR